MLARSLRVRLHSEFVSVTRTGRKARCGCVVVYRVAPIPQTQSEGSQSVSRAGLIVGRSVGNAVTRHRVARVIRAELAELLPQGQGELVVVRALPGAGSAGASQLRRDVIGALDRLRGRSCPATAIFHERNSRDLGQGSGTGPGVSS